MEAHRLQGCFRLFPAQFAGLINSNYLQVGSLMVSNTRVYGDVLDLVIRQVTNDALVTLFCEPGKPHILQGSINLQTWVPLVTNSPSGSFFEFLETNFNTLDYRFYRAVKPK
jgi:hypothetical protein